MYVCDVVQICLFFLFKNFQTSFLCVREIKIKVVRKLLNQKEIFNHNIHVANQMQLQINFEHLFHKRNRKWSFIVSINLCSVILAKAWIFFVFSNHHVIP